MSKIVSTFALVALGAAAAAMFKAWRDNSLAAKAQDKVDIHRWEDDGGQVPAVAAVHAR